MIWLLFTSATFLVLYSLLNIYVGFRSIHWPHVMGQINHSCVVVKVNKASSSKNQHYHPTVIYEYEVKNKKYINNKIGNYLAFGNNKEFAYQLISAYTEGNNVKVYYWPAFPKVSFLSPGMKQIFANYILLSTGVILVLGTFPTLFTDNPYWFIEKIFSIVDYVK